MSEEQKGIEFAAKVQKGGRLQIPRDIQEKMDIQNGDYVLLSMRKAEIREIETVMGVR